MGNNSPKQRHLNRSCSSLRNNTGKEDIGKLARNNLGEESKSTEVKSDLS